MYTCTYIYLRDKATDARLQILTFRRTGSKHADRLTIHTYRHNQRHTCPRGGWVEWIMTLGRRPRLGPGLIQDKVATTRVQTHIQMNLCLHTHTYLCAYAYIRFLHIHRCIHNVYIHLYVRIHINMRTHKFVVCVCVCVVCYLCMHVFRFVRWPTASGHIDVSVYTPCVMHLQLPIHRCRSSWLYISLSLSPSLVVSVYLPFSLHRSLHPSLPPALRMYGYVPVSESMSVSMSLCLCACLRACLCRRACASVQLLYCLSCPPSMYLKMPGIMYVSLLIVCLSVPMRLHLCVNLPLCRCATRSVNECVCVCMPASVCVVLCICVILYCG